MDTCTNCGSPNVKHIPAGLSKTKKDAQGNPKPYKAFSVCDDCKTIQNNTRGSQPLPPPAPPSAVEGILGEIRDLLVEINNKIKGEEIPF